MDLTWSIEDVARTSDDAAVRRRFAQRNRVWLTFLVVFAGCVAFGQMIASGDRDKTLADVVIAFTNGLWILLSMFLLRRVWRADRPAGSTPVGTWLRHHISAAALAFVAVQYVFNLTFTRKEEWVGWIFVYPLFTLAFRMPVADLVLLHCYLIGGGFLMAAGLGSFPRPLPGAFYFAIFATNTVALGLELFFSHRMRKEMVGEWTARRSQAREQLRMRDELRYARELQLSMIPECAPSLDWADVCSVSIPATEVGGDYYDYFVEENRMALVCGDVAGHGMSSGLVLAGLRSGFTLLRDSLGDPAAVLQRLHDMVAQTTRRRMLVTVSVVLLDNKARRAIIASAGHPPVIVRHANGTIETIALYAPPLGVRLPLIVPQRQLPIAAGDIFVLHSDGIYETRNASDESYGIDRLEHVIRDHTGETAESLRDAILRDVAEFRGSGEQDDDVTVVVCRIR
ncbi:MAG TPA: PP2C family protein-serine/threonine phosphatase [Thermoanaerobaculia bacterium]|nr:PP2C family protein-serine/threonine phosphatase [Thermoanaerobaculia bacterium]